MIATQNKTSAHVDQNTFNNSINRKKVVRIYNGTSSSLMHPDPYSAPLPKNLDVFSNLSSKFAEIEDENVLVQVKRVLNSLYLSIQQISKLKTVNKYLSRLNLVQQSDGDALLEWNFRDFRIGFTFEPDKNKSSYFIVSQDRSNGAFFADSKLLTDDVTNIINNIVRYVWENV